MKKKVTKKLSKKEKKVSKELVMNPYCCQFCSDWIQFAAGTKNRR